MRTRPFSVAIVLVVAPLLVLAFTRLPDDGPLILFSYFTGNGETGVYLQHSNDGLTFELINGGRPVFTPPASWPEDQRLTRDPSIIYHDGTFHMVWTTNWSGRVFGYARSSDLRTWTDATMVRPFSEGLPESQQPTNVWAPEIHYDPVEDDYFVVFSSTIPAMLEEGVEGRDTHGNNHRMYITRTADFETFTDAEVFYDPGFSSIDGQLVYDAYGRPGVADDRWIMVFKHERLPEHGGKNIRAVFRDAVTGAFSDYSGPIIGPGSGLNEHWAEGPSLLQGSDGMWSLYWDAYSDGYYGLARSPDRKAWVDVTDSLRIDIDHPRHGTFFTAPASAVGWLEAR